MYHTKTERIPSKRNLSVFLLVIGDPCEALTARFNCVCNKGSVVRCLR